MSFHLLKCKVEELISLVSKKNVSGNFFPASPTKGCRFYREDLNENFTYDVNLGKWLGELQQDGYGDSGGLTNNQYFRRYNGMGTGADRGINFPYDIYITEHGVNWESGGTTGGVEIETGGSTIVHTLPTTGGVNDHSHDQNVNQVIPANTVISFRRDGNSISNTQGWIKYKRII